MKPAPEEEDSWDSSRTLNDGTRTPTIQAFLAVSAAIAVIAVAYSVRQRKHSPGPDDPRPVVTEIIPKAPPAPAPETVKTSIETTVRGYLSANTNEERCKWVIGGRETLDRMAEFFARPETRAPGSFGQILDVGDAAFDGLPMHMVMAAEADGINGHLLSVFEIGSQLLIDWESSVNYGEMAWERFLAEKPKTPVQMRVYLQRDHYYNHGFADEETWDSYQLSTRGFPDRIATYVKKSGTLGETLRAIVPTGASQPVNAWLQWSDDNRALTVVGLLHNHWVDTRRIRKLTDHR